MLESAWTSEEDLPAEAAEAGDLPSAIQLYLQDIGRVPLLTREEEYELFRRMEAGRYVAELLEQLHQHSGRAATDEELVTELVRRLEHGLRVARACGAAPPPEWPLMDRLSYPPLREAIDGRPQAALVERGAEVTGWPQADVAQALWELSVVSRLLPARFLEQLDRRGREARASVLAGGVPGAGLEEAARTVRNAVPEGEQARQQVVQANLRLVVRIAKAYGARHVPLLDLVQEGNTGLMMAAQRFDYRRGFRFTTYATWWIRQTIGRGLINQERLIRLPVHISEQVSRYKRARADLLQRHNREPTQQELAEALGISLRRVRRLEASAAQTSVSLETPVGEDGEVNLSELVESVQVPSPEEETAHAMLVAELRRSLRDLTDREQAVIGLRYGLRDGEPMTLQQVGGALGLTRERVRQIEHKALRKLRRACEGPAGREAAAVGR